MYIKSNWGGGQEQQGCARLLIIGQSIYSVVHKLQPAPCNAAYGSFSAKGLTLVGHVYPYCKGVYAQFSWPGIAFPKINIVSTVLNSGYQPFILGNLKSSITGQ